MSLRKPGARDQAGGLSEQVARRVNRRDALRRAVLGGTTGLAALALGTSPAQAAGCWCGPTRRCGSCPEVGCPPGHQLCTSKIANCVNTQGFPCEWPSGSWIACVNLGKGMGYKVCYDCIGASGCEHWCTCLSECICCHCASPADIRAEQKRLQHALER
jgi:hypothetical protein